MENMEGTYNGKSTVSLQDVIYHLGMEKVPLIDHVLEKQWIFHGICNITIWLLNKSVEIHYQWRF